VQSANRCVFREEKFLGEAFRPIRSFENRNEIYSAFENSGTDSKVWMEEERSIFREIKTEKRVSDTRLHRKDQESPGYYIRDFFCLDLRRAGQEILPLRGTRPARKSRWRKTFSCPICSR
jgi:hypothetical protein